MIKKFTCLFRGFTILSSHKHYYYHVYLAIRLVLSSLKQTNKHTKKYKLTLKASNITAADNIHKYFHCLSENIRLDVSSESSARQRIHMKNQALFSSKASFSSKDKSKKLKCCLQQFLFGALSFKKKKKKK